MAFPTRLFSRISASTDSHPQTGTRRIEQRSEFPMKLSVMALPRRSTLALSPTRGRPGPPTGNAQQWNMQLASDLEQFSGKSRRAHRRRPHGRPLHTQCPTRLSVTQSCPVLFTVQSGWFLGSGCNARTGILGEKPSVIVRWSAAACPGRGTTDVCADASRVTSAQAEGPIRTTIHRLFILVHFISFSAAHNASYRYRRSHASVTG
jgi:hypothetical protein